MAHLQDIVVPPGLDEAVTLVVDASSSEDDGELEVAVSQSGVAVERPDLKLSKDETLKKHTIEFKPPAPDKYTVSIKHAGSEITGSPLELNLSPPQAKEVSLTKPPTGRIRAGQSISLMFDTFPAGRGEFAATCKGEAAGEIPVLVKREGVSTSFLVTFLPPQEDEYLLSVTYSGEEMKGSPFRIDLVPVKPDRVKCSKLVIPEDLSGPIEMDVCTEGAGNSKLKAKCVGEVSGEVPVNVHDVSKNNYHLRFEPPQKDSFTLSVLYGGKHVKDSPFMINTASRPDKVKIGELHVPDSAGTDEEVWIELDCSEAGREEVTADCKGMNEEGAIPVSVEELDSSTYRVKFTPKVADIYSLTLFYGGDAIPGGTFEINLLPKSEAKFVEQLGTFIPDDHSEPVVLNFDASKAGHGEMRARVSGISQAGPVASNVKFNEAKNEYEVSFVPAGADTYNVDVYWSNETIPGSPIYVKLVYPSEVLVSAPVDPQLAFPIKVDIDTQFAGPGVLSVSCLGKVSGDAGTEIIQNDYDNSKYTVYLHPVEADFYSLRIFFNEIEIKHSPVEVDLRVSEPVEESFCAVIKEEEEIDLDDLGSPIKKSPDLEIPTKPTMLEMTIGEPLTVNVDNFDGHTELTAVAHGKDLSEVPISISLNESSNLYTIVFNPSQPDTYTIDMKMNDEHVPNSPFVVVYAKTKEPPKPPPTHPITKPYLIKYIPLDDSLEDILAYAIHDDSCTRKVLKIRSRNERKALLAFEAEKTGLHYIHIKHGGKEIHGSPFKLEIVLSDPSACRVLVVPKKAYIGEEAVITIDASKAGVGDMHVIATVPSGGKGTKFSHNEKSEGIFDVKFTPKVAGKHSLNIRWAKVIVPFSPICVNVHQLSEEVKQARDAASRVRVLDEDKNFSTKINHAKGAYFFVFTEKAGQGMLSVKAKGPGDAKINVLKLRSAFYKCEVQPTVSGKYLLSILWDGILVPGHPYELDFTADKTYVINDLDFEGEQFVLERPSEYRIDCSHEEGELEILANPSDCAQVNVTPLEGNGGKVFVVKIVPKRAGNHEISLKFAERHILRSPYHVQFETMDKSEQESLNNRLLRLSGIDFPVSLSDSIQDASNAPSANGPTAAFKLPKIVAFGAGLEGGVIGQEGNFTIKTDGAGDGKLKIAIQGARGTFKTQLRHHPDSERTVLARYDPTNIGKYTVDIRWLDEHIEGSPFVVDIKAQEATA